MGFTCTDIKNFPKQAEPSADFRALFNDTAKELKLDIEWVSDDPKKGRQNLPDAGLRELTSKSGIRDARKLHHLACGVLRTVEERRALTTKASYDTWQIVPSATFQHMDVLTPAEKAWLEKVSPELAKISSTIYGKQTSVHYEVITQWMNDSKNHMDQASLKHFNRIKTHQMPTGELPPNGTDALARSFDFKKYASSIPWFPKLPNYSAMWPADMTKAELDYLTKTYKKDEPILLTYTITERATAADREKIAKSPRKNSQGQPVEWIYEGRDDQGRVIYYKVTNISFHERFRADFLRAAKVLRENATDGLNPSFKNYTLTMAKAMEDGDFTTWLQADLNQTEGNIFLTFFPHEGYWADGLKFPFRFDVGIRQVVPVEEAARQTGVFQKIENYFAQVLIAQGVNYTRREFSLEDAAKTSQVIWMYKEGGKIRASIDGEVSGHDYPKRDYAGITLHRVVTILDSVDAAIPMRKKMLELLLSPEEANLLTLENVAEKVVWHEGTHGCGMRPDTPTLTGQTFAQAFGQYWGIIAEPLADMGSYAALGYLGLKGDALKNKQVSYLTWLFFRMMPKKAMVEDKALREMYHFVGSMAQLGWLAHEGVLALKADGKLEIQWGDKLTSAMRKFQDVLIKFSGSGDVAGYIEFVKKCINTLSDDVEKVLLDVKAKAKKPFLVDRNDGL